MINRAILTGRLTRDVDLRYTPSGIAVGNFRLAVDRNFKNRNGQREADFINCVIWRKGAENFANFTHKGSLVGIDGRLQSRSYDNKQGQRVYVTEIVVDNFALLESRSQDQSQTGASVNHNRDFTSQNGGGQTRINPFARPNPGQLSRGQTGSANSVRKPRPATAPKPKSRPQSDSASGPKNQSVSKPKVNQDSNKPDHTDHTKDPFKNSGNKKIDISDNDLPF